METCLTLYAAQMRAGGLMMTSSNGDIFRVTDPLCGELPENSPHNGQ